MTDILSRAEELNVKFDKNLARLSELLILLSDVERQRDYLRQEGTNTTLHDEIIEGLEAEIEEEAKGLE